jgi:hypothetical protein
MPAHIATIPSTNGSAYKSS